MELIPIRKGSDLDLTVTWGGEDDLDGATVTLYDVHPSLDGCISASMLDPTERTILCSIVWEEGIVNGAHFRIRVTISGRRATSLRYKLEVE